MTVEGNTVNHTSSITPISSRMWLTTDKIKKNRDFLTVHFENTLLMQKENMND